MSGKSSVIKIDFVPNPVQKRFIESRARADLFSSRMGEGKSAALAWAVWWHTLNNPGARWAIIRDTWETLRDTTQKEFFKWFPPGIFGHYNKSEKTFYWTAGGMEGEVMFMGMDDPSDASKLQSRELAGFGMDEPAPAAESGGINEFIFDVAMSRLRQPGMKWYAAKLAQNNSDESHWTYKRFVEEPNEGFVVWQPDKPENERNLPPDYYATLRMIWAHRPDMVARFVDGQYGFQRIGRPVTPEWSDKVHLATGLVPVKGQPLYLLWDFGLNPTCIITQVTPLGHWLILDSFVGEEMGVAELIETVVKPRLQHRYRNFVWEHIGDPQGSQREQSSSATTAVRVLRKTLGGKWRPGPRNLQERVEPLRWTLRQMRNGTGLVQVDRSNAKEVWYALRGGWHHHVARTGIVSREPTKDMHSHPGDAMGYGAAVLFPLGTAQQRMKRLGIRQPSFMQASKPGLGIGRPDARPRGAALRID